MSLLQKFGADNNIITKKHQDLDIHIVKYANHVFFKGLWYDATIQARGAVVDFNDDEYVVRPFDKVFNNGENGVKINPHKIVHAVKKVNGYLGCFTYSRKFKRSFFTTTGTFDSDFAKLFEKNMRKTHQSFIDNVEKTSAYQDITFMFEVCDPTDTHIIEEKEGLYLIGARYVSTGNYYKEHQLDSFATLHGFMRPEWSCIAFSDVLKMCNVCEHEGYMIRDVSTGQYLAKLKSPHYLSKKFFMRTKPEKLFDSSVDYKQRVDEEYYYVIECIRRDYNIDTWSLLTKEQKLSYLTNIFKDGKYMMSKPNLEKVCVIVRGVCGSGKSTFATMMSIQSGYDGSYNVCTADDYMVDDNGRYDFKGHRLPEVHQHCFDKFKGLVDDGCDMVIVANTATRKSEYSRYKEYAEVNGYTTFVLEMNGNFKNEHGVPDDKVKQMRERFER